MHAAFKGCCITVPLAPGSPCPPPGDEGIYRAMFLEDDD